MRKSLARRLQRLRAIYLSGSPQPSEFWLSVSSASLRLCLALGYMRSRLLRLSVGYQVFGGVDVVELGLGVLGLEECAGWALGEEALEGTLFLFELTLNDGKLFPCQDEGEADVLSVVAEGGGTVLALSEEFLQVLGCDMGHVACEEEDAV